MKTKRYILVLLFACHVLFGFGQTYPIYVTTSLTPPYSLNLSDYTKIGSQQLIVNIMVNDLNISNLPVKLHLKMETTAGVSIETPPTITTLPIYLSGGQMNVLYGDDLKDYFNINNLIFKGYSKEDYRRNGQLPEGFYRFTVDVLHYGTNRPISNHGTATAWFALGKPPLLKTPDEGAELGQIQGMPLTFSWLPSNVGAPTGGVQYTFEMWEMRIPGIDPYVVAASTPVFYSRTLYQGTSLIVHPAELFLEQGMHYAWRITAADPSGFIPFAQQGRSLMRTFTYQAHCDTVAHFTAKQQLRMGSFQWDPAPNHTSFNTEMRDPVTGWFRNSDTFDNKISYSELEYGSTYQMRVQAVCNSNPEHVSPFTEWQTLHIPEKKPDDNSCPECECGVEFPAKSLTNFDLKYDLQPGDTIITPNGSTRYIIETITPTGNGRYKGLFLFWWEYYKLKIRCEYWNLMVNTDNQIIKVGFESLYNPNFVLDVDAAKAYVDNIATAIATITVNTDIKDTLQTSTPIGSMYLDERGKIIIVNPTGDDDLSETSLEDLLGKNLNRTLVQGPNGEEYVITRDGKALGVDEFKHTGGDSKLMEKYKEEKERDKTAAYPAVTFIAHPKQQYGFDAYTETKFALQTEYPELKPGYHPPFKSVPSFKTDKVSYNIATPADSKKISFRDEMGLPPLSGQDNELTVRGSTPGSDVTLYAYNATTDSTEEVTGKLNILSFAEQNKKVYLVPVNNITLPGKEKIEAELNRIYASAIFQWRVETKPSINVTFPSGKLTHGGSSSVSVYNADQKKVLNTFGAMEEDAYYLFFVKDVDYKDRIGEIGGYMPMQYQAGFIYGNPNTATIAHELAHGAFNLEHTFKSYAIPERATANLLDYNNGEELWKYQWKLISNPNHLWLKFLQGEEDAEEIRLANIAALAPLKKNKTYTFFTPDRQCISLPENVQNVYFSTGMNLVTADSTRNETNDFFPLGSLSAFEIGNILYEAINTNTRFDGYYHYPQPGNYKLREKSALPIAACNEAIALFATKDDEGSTVFGVGLFSKGDSTNACVANFHIPDLTQPVEQSLLKRNIKNDSLLILKGLYYLARTETNANPEIWTSTYKPYNEADFKELSERLTTTLYETQSSGVSALIRDFKTSDKNTEYALDDVTDRLKVFDREVDGTRIIVHIAASKCHIPSDSMPGLAKKIWQESKVSTKNNVIYIVIPCWDERKTSNSLLVKNQTSWDFSIYSNQTNVESFKASDNVVESILNVYKSIPKPYYKIKHFITGSEAGVYLTTTEVEKDENKAGKTCIYDYVLLADKRIDEISSIESAKKWHTINYSVTLNDGYNQSQSEEYLKQQQSFQTDINNFYTQHPDPSYQRIRHGLLESALIDENGKIASVPFQYSDWYLSSIKHVFFISMFDNKMSNDSFVSGRNEAMGEDLLNALDAVGLGLSLVSLDVVTDVISISVAGYYNKPEQSVLYSASTMIPIISGGMTHAAIKGAENLSGVAKGTHIIEKGADGSFVVVKKGGKIAESLFTSEGKFIDNVLETDYQKYIVRKTKEGKPPRERLDWKEVREYWLYDSPLARGNEFNKKASFEYDINELNLKLDNGKNVRVDSYVLPKNGVEGKIISRKATDLGDIQESTFRSYLSELKSKYASGTIIRSDKYPHLDGKKIQGKQYLEIPENNKSFYDMERYTNIAKEYDIEIIFLKE